MKIRELRNLGFPKGEELKLAQALAKQAKRAGLPRAEIRQHIKNVLSDPSSQVENPYFAELAKFLEEKPMPIYHERKEPAPWKQWGTDLEKDAIQQMVNACRLPVSHSGALMPDAHVGYGLPIGGVLATKDAVIPYAVGVDIACRMRLTVTDIPIGALKGEKERLSNILEEETRFGIGASFRKPRDHQVLDEDWSATDVTKRMQHKARSQLGTSGSGNHFVEYGIFQIEKPELDLAPGKYLAILSHSGSRGPGAAVANHYSKLAMQLRPELPKQLKHLAWLDLDSEEGQEYWYAMNLMGQYAAANHEVIHREMIRALKANVLSEVENHHNFAWKEVHNGEELIVHRKGATPAGEGVLGIIPGSMASPAFIVRGRGDVSSLQSAAHGAGRVMSRKKAKNSFTWSEVKKELRKKEVTLLSAGLDEVPGVYKDIHKVMREQEDLVDILATFHPKIVKMAPAGERPED